MAWPKKDVRREEVWFQGIKFVRYPDAKRIAHRRYYKPHGGHIGAGVQALHQEVWKAANGPIPKGFQVHHKDGNPGNNEISNLELLTSAQHHAEHRRMPTFNLERAKRSMDWARKFAPKWHRSKGGRAWHGKHGRGSWVGRQPEAVPCSECGENMNTFFRHKRNFCSERCTMRYHRKAGTYSATGNCAGCGKEFSYYKYLKQRYCSRSCAAKAKKPRRLDLRPNR